MVFVLAFRYKEKPNISERLVRSLRQPKFVLAPPYDTAVLLNRIRELKPDLIIAIGQSRKGHLVRIERTARRVLAIHKKVVLKSHKKLHATLRIRKVKGTRVSYDAGTYFCNYVFYELLDQFRSGQPKVALLHVPKTLALEKAERTVKKILASIQHSSSSRCQRFTQFSTS
jgi:pyrrolidone-carboxylate peptidase